MSTSKHPLTVLTLLGVVLTAGAARAASGGAPISVSHSGYALDGSDTPIAGPSVSLVARIFDAATTGTLEWEATCANVAVRGGYYSVVLGSGACVGSSAGGLDPVLDTSDLPAGAARWLELAIGGVTLSPRLALSAAPTAARAISADLLGTHPASDFALASSLAPVASSGDYGALSNRPALSAVATSGQYADLAGKPIGSVLLGKWCTWSGSQIVCTSDAPSGGSGGSGGQASAGTASPSACGAATAGYLWYDSTVPALKVCNGATYVSVNAVAGPPGPPGAPNVAALDSQLSVSWSAVAGATSYEVGYKIGAVVDAGATVVAVPSGTSVTLSPLTNGTTYAVAVRTVAGGWTSAWSPVVQRAPSVAGYLNCLTASLHPNNSSQDVIDLPVGTWACFISSDGWVYSLKVLYPLPRTTGTTGLIGGTSRSYIDEVWTRTPGGVWRQTTAADDPPTRQGPPNQMYTDGGWYGNGAYWLFSDASCTGYISTLTYSFQIWSGLNCGDGSTTLFWAGGSKHYINQLRY